MKKNILAAISLLAASAVALSACSPQNQKDSDGSQPAASSSSKAAAGGASASDAPTSAQATDSELSFDGGVVRAMAKDSDMTAIFGTLNNHSDKDVEIAGFETSIKADMTQLHETVDGQMREMDGPLVVPAGGQAVLEPGGNHLMLMGVKEPVSAGETVKVSLKLMDGEKIDLGEIPVRSIGAGNENYGDVSGQTSGQDMPGMEGMNHSESAHSH